MTVAEVLRRSTGYLERRGSPTPRLDAELLLADALELSRVELYMAHDRPLTEAELGRSREMIRRRGEREPVGYITGRTGFRHLDLVVSGSVLLPRPETEHVVDRCLELLAGRDAPAVLDVGTGSGAIALAIACELPGARVSASDVSSDALDVAWANAVRLGVELELRRSDLLASYEGRRFDLIVSNPPYVGQTEIDALEPEVRDWEPRLATVAGADGLDVYRRLLPQAREHLVAGGAVVLECGGGQAAWLCEELVRVGFGPAAVDDDLAGIGRVVWATRG